MSSKHPLLDNMINAGLLSQEPAQTHQSSNNVSPWYIKILLAVSGWLGAVFFLGFIFLLMNDLFDEPFTAGLFGVSLVIAAYFIIRVVHNDFFEHLGLATSLAGQALVVFSLIDNADNAVNWLFIGIFHVVLAVIMPNFVHRVFSAIFSALSFDIACTVIGAPYIVSSVALILLVMFSINEFKSVKIFERVNGIIYGLVMYWLLMHCVTPFNVELVELLSRRSEPLFELPVVVIQGSFITAIMFSMVKLLKQSQLSLRSQPVAAIIGITFVFTVLTINATGISAALIVILLGFSRSNRVMVGLGIIALIIYCCVYYYNMEETLLYKSGVLLVITMLMLVCRLLLVKFWPQVKEQ